MTSDLKQSRIHTWKSLPIISLRFLLLLVIASVAVVASATWSGAPETTTQQDPDALPSAVAVAPIPVQSVLADAGGARLQAGKVWDLVEVELEVIEETGTVLTHTLALGTGGVSHSYESNLWKHFWGVTGTALVNASLRVLPPLAVREGEPATMSLSGVFGVTINDPGRTWWGDYTHTGEVGWLGGYGTGCRGDSVRTGLAGSSSATSSVIASCTLTPRAHWSNSWSWTAFGESTVSWRLSSPSRPVVFLKVRPTYQLRTSDSRAVVLQGEVNLAPQYAGARLLGVPVTLLRSGKVLAQAVTGAADGRYVMAQAPITTNLVLSVTLEHAAMSPPTFRVMYSQTAPSRLAYVTTLPFTITGAANPVVKNISFSDSPGITTSLVISPAHLDDLGVIYYHVHQAWQLTDRLKQPLDNRLPVDINAFSSRDDVFWTGPNSNGGNSGIDPYINIEASASDINDGGRPSNREWHEFGHHVMADVFGNLIPRSPILCHSPPQLGDDCNHGGYKNASTTDSWVEGFAEFFSLMVGREIMAVPRADLYRMSGSNVSLEANYLTWTGSVAGLPAASFARNIEEFAVASLLWDLVDPADADDATTFSAGGASYADCVATDLASLWGIISKPWGGVVVGSPQTPLTYTYIYDVKHLYDVLKHEGVGAAKSRGRALDDLDELFIAHGFFKDANSNRVYDAGEAIGWSGHGALPGATARLDRRSRPPIKGSYIAYQARSSQTGAPVPVQSVSVDVRFPPPLEHLDFSYTQPVETPGHIYFFAPDAQYGAASYVRAWAPGWVSTGPLTVTSSLYWERMAAEPQDHFVDHIFEMTRTVSLYLPLIVSEHGGSATTADALGATISAATAARTPRACAPEPIGGTATRTATRTATVQSGGSRTATVTATRTPTRTGTRTPTRTATRTLTRTATRTVTQTPTRTTTAGINGRVTANGAAAAGRTLELRHWNGSAWVIQSSVTTGADGRYTFSGVPALGANQWYYVRYLNSAAAPNPGPGYLWYWFANRFSSYTAGTTVAGGDFDIADVVMTQPADGATVTLPAAFCWTQRNEPSDNYRLIFRNPRTGQEALTNYLGYSPSCVIITAIPPDWPSGAVYTWWVRVYRGANPDATPDNYGDPSTTRDVRINH